MSAPRARSSAEAHMFMALHPCERCGDANFVPVVRQVREDGGLVTRFTGRCGTCRALRDFRFRIDREWADAGAAPGDMRFGANTPSEIIDAGQWLRAADRILAETPSNVLGVTAEEWRERRHMFTAAAESVGELLKFIPAGADTVPATAFWTDSGREMHARVPDRFDRDRLEHLRGVCLELAARFST